MRSHLSNGSATTFFCRAIPPSDDHLALGCIASTALNKWPESIIFDKFNEQEFMAMFGETTPSANVADRFRAGYKSALTLLTKEVTPGFASALDGKDVFCYDQRHVFADTALPSKADCYVLHPAYIDQDSGLRAVYTL